MYSKVEEYKNILKSDEQQYDAYIILEDGTKVDTDISGFRPIYNLGEKIIGNFTTKKIEFTLFDTSKYNITNKEIEAFVGLKVNDEFNYISLGKFITDKPVIKDETQDECTISATNYSLKFKIPYKPILTFPCTINKAIKDICDHLNIEYVENDFINKDYVLQKFFIEEEATFFDVIKILVEAGFANAIITNTNALIVKSPGMTVDYVLSLNELFDLKKEDNVFGPVNSIVASRIVADDGSTTEDVYKKDEDSVNVNGLYEYKIIQNEAIDYDRQTAVNNMLAGILNFEYNPAKIEAVYNPAIEIGDMLEVPDKKTATSFLLLVKEITADLSSGLMTIKSTEKTQTETDYKSATAKDKRRNTEIKVNKMEGKITQLVEETTENSEKLAQQQITIDGITQKVENVVETTKTVKGLQAITLENCVDGNLLELRIFGHNTNFDFLFPDEDLFPSEDLYPNHDEENMTAVYEIQVTNEDGTSEVYRLAETYWLSKNDETQDVFELKNGKLTITRRVNIYDGTTRPFELYEELGEKSIFLKAGTNTITLLSHNANIEAKYAVQNEYTKNFATKIELKSAIVQTKDNINLSVNKKLESYSTTEQMNAIIDIKAGEITNTVKTTINNLEIGGRNYLLNTDKPVEMVKPSSNYNIYQYENVHPFVLKKLNKDVTYTISFKFLPKQDNYLPFDSLIVGGIDGVDKWQIRLSTNQFTVENYEQYELWHSTFIISGNGTHYLQNFVGFVLESRFSTDCGGTVYEIKLEEGNKYTDWSVAPEDTNMAISQIKQTADNVSIEVKEKVGENEVISKINASPETVGIKSNKIELSANDILNLLAGNSINLSSKNITISSNSFNVDNEGNVTLKATGQRVFKVENKNNPNERVYITNKNIVVDSSTDFDRASMGLLGDNSGFVSVTSSSGKNTTITGDNVTTPVVNQTSLATEKKNFEKLKYNALEIIKQIEIYKYHLKGENDKDKKHIGFIIGDDFKYSEEVTNAKNDGVDIYSFISLCCKGLQEQQQEIEELKKELNTSKGVEK